MRAKIYAIGIVFLLMSGLLGAISSAKTTEFDDSSSSSRINNTRNSVENWWDSSWEYRIPINITEESGTNLYDYRVLVKLNN